MEENNDGLQSIQQAPPFAPSGQDIDAQAAARGAQASLSASHQLTSSTPTGNTAPSQFDSGSPRVPAGPGSFGDKLAGALSAAKAGADAATLQQPGAWSKLMIGATMDALSQPTRPAPEAAPTAGPGSTDFQADTTTPTAAAQAAPAERTTGQKVNDSLADLSAAQGPGGLFGGLTRTAAAQRGRERQDMKDKLQMAVSNAQMIHEQALTHKLGDDAMQENIATGKQSIASMTAPPPSGGTAGTVDAAGKTSDELNKMIQNGEFHPSTQTAFPDGRVMEGKDANGLPIWRTTYSVVTPPASMSLGEENAKLIADNLGKKIDPKQVLPGTQVNTLLQQANNAKAANEARDYAAKKNQIELDKVNATVESKAVAQDKRVVNALASVSTPGKDGSADPNAVIKAYNALKISGQFDDPKNPLSEAAFKVWAAGDDKAFDTMRENYAKQQQKSGDAVNSMIDDYTKSPDKIAGHTPAVIAAADAIINDPKASTDQKAQANRLKATALQTQSLETELQGARELSKDEMKEAAKKKAETASNPNGLTGKAFLDTLPPARRNAIEAFGKGLISVSPSALERTDKGQAYLSDLYAAFPDLDTTKAPAYTKMRADFTSGKDGRTLNSANTVMAHMNTMLDSLEAGATAGYTGATEAYFGKNDAGRTLKNTSQTLSNELDKFYSGGVGSEAEKEEWRKKLDPFTQGMTNDKLKKNIHDFSKLVGGKLEAFQTQWDDGVPSKYIAAPKQMADPKSIATYKRATGTDLDVHQYQPGFGPQTDVEPALGPTPASQAKVSHNLPQAPAGQVSVQIPGFAPGFVSQDKLAAFKLKHPNAVVSQ